MYSKIGSATETSIAFSLNFCKSLEIETFLKAFYAHSYSQFIEHFTHVLFMERCWKQGFCYIQILVQNQKTGQLSTAISDKSFLKAFIITVLLTKYRGDEL